METSDSNVPNPVIIVHRFPRLHFLAWKLKQKSWWWFLPFMNWLHNKTAHCNEPEYFKAHPKLIRLTGGIKQFSWTWICGHHFGFSFHMGNIYWRIPLTKAQKIPSKMNAEKGKEE